MKLSVVIPCFNEIGTIGQVIEAVKASPVKKNKDLNFPINKLEKQEDIKKNLEAKSKFRT